MVTETRWDEQMTAAWAATRGLVVSKLAASGYAQDADDVMQKTWITADAALGNFDPDRGSFGNWIKGVANFQVQKHLAAEKGRHRAAEAAAAAAGSDVLTPFDVIGADPSERVMDQLDAIQRVSRVLVVLRQVIGEVPVLLERSMHLVLSCDGDVALAARRLGVRPEALRDSHRNILDLAQVIDKALSTWWVRREQGRSEDPVPMREVLGCLPSAEASSRQWIVHLAHATIRCGGFGAVTAPVLAEITGWSVVTCRHGLARTQRLVNIALPLIRDGALPAGRGLTGQAAEGEETV